MSALTTEKEHTILDWETPTCVQEVKSFVGFAGPFIEAFSRLTKPLHGGVR